MSNEPLLNLFSAKFRAGCPEPPAEFEGAGDPVNLNLDSLPGLREMSFGILYAHTNSECSALPCLRVHRFSAPMAVPLVLIREPISDQTRYDGRLNPIGMRISLHRIGRFVIRRSAGIPGGGTVCFMVFCRSRF